MIKIPVHGAICLLICSLIGCNSKIDGRVSASLSNPLDTEIFELTILHLNDTHSYIKGDHFNLLNDAILLNTKKKDGSPINKLKVSYGGYPKLITLFKKEEEASQNVLKLHAGDSITGTKYHTLFKGPKHVSPDSVMMNQICFDAFTIGNHEFDDGDSGLADFIYDLHAHACDTPVLSANTNLSKNSAALMGEKIQPYVIINRGGIDVAIVGITIGYKTAISSNPDNGTTFSSELETAKITINKLSRLGVDHIVLLTHNQYQRDIDMAKTLSGVDIIVGGDSHSLLGDSTFTNLGFHAVGEYPTITRNADGDVVCIVQAWENTHLMGKLHATFKNGKISSCEGFPLMPIGEVFTYEDIDGLDKLLSKNDQQKVLEFLSREDELVAVTDDPEALILIEQYDQQIDTLLKQVIGFNDENLCLERIPGQGRSKINGCRKLTYRHGSDITALIAKAFWLTVSDADVAIQNSGGARVDLPKGKISFSDLYDLLPYSNRIVTADMSGAKIIAVLESALENHIDNGGSTGSFPYAFGLRFNVDTSKRAGSRISEVEVISRKTMIWSAIDTSRKYRIVTNNFLSTGKDGYKEFSDIKWTDTYIDYHDPIAHFIEGLSEQDLKVSKLPKEEYSIKSFIDPDGCNHSIYDDCMYTW